MRRVFLILAVALIGACASNPQGVGSAAAQKSETSPKLGVIESVTPIELDASTYAGANVGGVFGQVGGANSGGGRGAVVGSILGGVLGGTLGQQAGVATKPGLEIWVKLDDTGKSTYIMQPGKPDEFKVGDRVRIVNKRGDPHVEPENAPVAPDKPAQP